MSMDRVDAVKSEEEGEASNVAEVDSPESCGPNHTPGKFAIFHGRRVRNVPHVETSQFLPQFEACQVILSQRELDSVRHSSPPWGQEQTLNSAFKLPRWLSSKIA